MARTPRSVDQAIARFDDLAARLDGHVPATRGVPRRTLERSALAWGRRLANIGVAIGGLIVATVAWGLVIGPIGWGGLFILVLAIFAVLAFFSTQSLERPVKPYSEAMPNREVVRTLDGFLTRRRAALPAPAARQVDVIAQQLPLLESRLAEVNPLDPLAQDARRLMGKHLPELIERYERVPAAYRRERDGEGMTVDERLAVSLGAAETALKEIGMKLAKEDMDAFETQGRFIESRYRDEDAIRGE